MWEWKGLCGLAQAPVTEAQAGAARASESRKHLEKRKWSRLGRPLVAVGGAFQASAGRVGRPGARKGTFLEAAWWAFVPAGGWLGAGGRVGRGSGQQGKVPVRRGRGFREGRWALG